MLLATEMQMQNLLISQWMALGERKEHEQDQGNSKISVVNKRFQLSLLKKYFLHAAFSILVFIFIFRLKLM